jgi:tryptophan synthase alpha chain
MSEIARVFADLKERNEAALIPYVTIGDPSLRHTARFVSALIEGGADIVELGIPFSDPIADGPTIQAAVKRSLEGGAKPLDSLKIARTIREKHDVPLVLMTYYNPIFRAGLEEFLRSAKQSGVSGMIVPDLPIEESEDYRKRCVETGVDTIFLASPSTEAARLKEIISATSGYLYLISLYGVTGVRNTIPRSAVELVKKHEATVRERIPIAVGFGISEPHQVSDLIRAGANGVIVGSAFVSIIGANRRNVPRAEAKLRNLARTLKRATKPKS